MNIELLKEGIKKFYILPLILTVILLLVVPVSVVMQKDAIDESAINYQNIDTLASSLENPVDLNLEQSYKNLAGASVVYNPFVMLTILILPVVLGAQLFGHSKKMENRLTSFIVKKGLNNKTAYKTNILTGMILSIAPVLVSAIGLLVVKFAMGMGDYVTTNTLISWTCLGVFSSIVVFAFTALIGFITKNRPIQILYTYGFMVIPVIVIYLIEIFTTRVIYGFPGFTAWILEIINNMPAINVCQVFLTRYVNTALSNSMNLWYVLFYVIISAAIVFGGYKLLSIENKEKLEKVGDKIFKYLWIIIVGILLYTGSMLSCNKPIVAILVTVVVLLVIYILKEIISKKSFKAISNGKRYYIMAIASIFTVVLLSSNMFGYETKIPNAEDVEYMTYTLVFPNKNDEIEFRNKDNIQYLIDKHKEFVLEKNQVKAEAPNKYTTVYLQYKLKNGKSVIRGYETILSTDEKLFESEEYIKQKYSYMYDKKDGIDIMKIAGIYNGKKFEFSANRYENLDLLNETISNIADDLLKYSVHIPSTDEYQLYSDKEGIQFIQVAILDGINPYNSYVYYLKVDNSYGLVKQLQNLIEEESEHISWSE